MNEARAEILQRISAALDDVPRAERPCDVRVQRDYRSGRVTSSLEERIERFAHRLRDYSASVDVVDADEVRVVVARTFAAWGAQRVAVPPALPGAWRPQGVPTVEDHGLGARELDAIGGAVTGCAAAIAETGTIILDGSPRCGRRLLSLIPGHLVCVVRADQIVDGVPEGLAAVAPAARELRSPITLVSGPSASSDIEFSRVEGVHGPRHLLVVVVRSANRR